ncbi:MAG TPA: (2Fe-2S)-binding protein [Spirochaetia bacterium]|nr:(2Fe-2S)-binding protein [Spirochaetia bacterium]
MDKDSILCRCEDIDLAGMKELLAAGARTLDEIKRLGRLGMGPCQGRTCLPLAARLLAEHLGCPLEEIELPAARPPFEPIPLGALAGEVDTVD